MRVGRSVVLCAMWVARRNEERVGEIFYDDQNDGMLRAVWSVAEESD